MIKTPERALLYFIYHIITPPKYGMSHLLSGKARKQHLTGNITVLLCLQDITELLRSFWNWAGHSPVMSGALDASYLNSNM